MLPVKNDFTGNAVKKFYRFLPVMTSKNSQQYSTFSKNRQSVPFINTRSFFVFFALSRLSLSLTGKN